MVNSVANTASAALASVAALKGHLQEAAAHVPAVGQSGILQFTKHGEWVMGQEKTEVTVDDLFAVNPTSFVTGFVCWPDDQKLWKNGPLGEVSVPLGHKAPLAHELPEHANASWQAMTGFSLRFTEGDHKGKEAKYTTTSKGGMTAVRAIMDAVIARLDEDPVNIVPVISAGADSYVHKVYGKTFTPSLDIEAWVSMDGVAAVDEEAPEDTSQQQASKAPDPVNEPDPAAAADPAPEPARRRRRA